MKEFSTKRMCRFAGGVLWQLRVEVGWRAQLLCGGCDEKQQQNICSTVDNRDVAGIAIKGGATTFPNKEYKIMCTYEQN